MTHTYCCTNEKCKGTVAFFNTHQGVLCMKCQRPAVAVPNEGPIVPYGVTREIEELDRMYSL